MFGEIYIKKWYEYFPFSPDKSEMKSSSSDLSKANQTFRLEGTTLTRGLTAGFGGEIQELLLEYV